MARTPHARKRAASASRAAEVAARLGFESIAAYVEDRHRPGLSLRAMAAESDQPPTWLRRHGLS